MCELKRETRRSLELTPPHIVRIHDFVQDAQHAAIAMEYVAGSTLAARQIEQPRGWFEVAEILAEELGRDAAWAAQVAELERLAAGYRFRD